MDVEDTIFEIFMISPIKEITRMSLISKRYHNIYNSSYLWKMLVKRDFNIENGTEQNYISLYKFYRKYGSDNINKMFQTASLCGHTDVVKILLQDSRVDPSANDNYAIRIVSHYGHTDVVKILLRHFRVDPSADDNYAIRWASLCGHTDVVKLLLRHSRVDPSANDNYAIKSANQNEHINIVEILLKDSRVKNTLTSEQIRMYSV